MLSDHPVYATIPTHDLPVARRFYEDVLGLTVDRETPATVYYRAGDGTFFALSRSAGASSGSHTQMGFRVASLETEMAALRERGVEFIEYPSLQTVDGIADMGAGRAAWFHDLDGNLLGLWQFKDAPAA
jgi:catechol 2,3-dioxygenase-like lactoylglutathione lyase family enzyme